jgi:hypothetical protein
VPEIIYNIFSHTNVIASKAKQSDPRIILSKSKDTSTSLGAMLCIGKIDAA